MPADGTARDAAGVSRSRLARLARGRGEAPIIGETRETGIGVAPESALPTRADRDLEQCELCAQEIPSDHSHLLDITSQRLLCVCRSCIVLFDNSAAGGRRFRRLPEVVRQVGDFELADPLWERLGIPVDIAFCFRSTVADRIVAFYPGPAGATESMLQLSAWGEIEALNPVLATLEPDVEALLVYRARGERAYWLVPVDVCYRLTGIMRTLWRGLSGGEEVWAALGSFFDELRRSSRHVDRAGRAIASRSADRHTSFHLNDMLDGGEPCLPKTTYESPSRR